MLCRSRNRQSELRLVLIRRLRSSATISNKVRSGCSATSARISVANCSSGEMLPPRGFGAALLFSRQRCSHLTAEATLTSKCSAASRRDAPASTASITRSRSSPENDCGIVRPPQANQCTKTLLSVFLWESPRFKSGGNRFRLVVCRFLGRRRGGVNYARCGRRPRSAKARSRGRWSQVVPRGLWGLRPVAASEAR